MSKKLYYQVLDIESGASAEQVKSAYKEKIKQYHPDTCDHEGAVILTRDLNTISRVLEKNQHEYDAADSHKEFVERNPSAKLTADWEEIFSNSQNEEDQNKSQEEDTEEEFTGDTGEGPDPREKSKTGSESKASSSDGDGEESYEDINPKYNNPSNYEGGYPPDWEARRKAVYKRDDYTCQNCGEKSGPYADGDGAVLHAHHVVLLGRGGSNKLDNLTTLCDPCHMKIHRVEVEFIVQSEEGNESISNAKIVVKNRGKTSGTLQTNSSGSASIQLGKGKYKASVQAEGYENSRTHINIASTPAGERITKRVSLSATKPTSDLNISRRGIVASAGLGVVGLALVFGGGSSSDETETTPEPTLEEARVTPGDNIQETINQIVDGGSLEIEPGTYTQHFQIERGLTVTSPDGATIGADGTGSPAITLGEADIDITGLTISGHDGGGIHGGGSTANISLDSVIVDGTDSAGIDVTGESVNIENVSIEDNNGVGVAIETTPDGEVNISGADLFQNRTGSSSIGYERKGIEITGGNDITIEESEIVESGTANLRINAGRSDGQTVTIRDVTTLDSGSGSGIYIEGTSGDDDYALSDVESVGNANSGVIIGNEGSIENISLAGLTVERNDDTGVSLELSDSGETDISGSNIYQNNSIAGVNEARGIEITGGRNITIEGTEIGESDTENLRIDAGRSNGQTVTVRDVFTFDSESGSGIYIEGTRSDDDYTLSDVESVGNNNNGVIIGREESVENVSLTGITAENNDDTGISIELSASGEIDISGADIAQNDSLSALAEKRGVEITGGNDITIEESEITESGTENLRIDAGRSDERSVTIRDVSTLDSASRSGIYIEGTRGAHEISVSNVESNSNDSFGLDLGGESVTIEDTTATDNGDGELNLQDIDREDAEITNSF